MTLTQINDRLVSFHAHCFQSPRITEKSQEWKDAKKVANIVSCVRSGHSSDFRLLTADTLLKKWGF